MDGGLEELNDLKSYLIGICNMYWKKHLAYEQKINRSIKNVEYYYYEHFTNSAYTFEVIEDAKEQLLSITDRSIALLGEKCRKLIRLFYFEKKSMTEIAETMGFNTQAVATATKYRCFKDLKQKALELKKELEHKAL